jgi:predicted RNA-binding protein YlqC (UPF0109 family)
MVQALWVLPKGQNAVSGVKMSDRQMVTQETDIKNLIETMAKSLVDNGDKVQVKECRGDQTTVYELYVMKSDLGKVIGREGKNANAMRTIMNAVATKMGKRVVLEIVDK